jgi:hypothetical protein
MPSDTIRILALIAAAALAGLGIWSVSLGRRDSEEARPITLAGIGRVSEITMLVAGLACLWSAYHVVVHTLNLVPDFRAPGWIAVAVAAGAVIASLGIDRLDNKSGD